MDREMERKGRERKSQDSPKTQPQDKEGNESETCTLWKEKLENMEKGDLEKVVLGDELFPDFKIAHEEHKLAPKEATCELCHRNRTETFRCPQHRMKCVCEKQFTSTNAWYNHKQKWTFKVDEAKAKKKIVRENPLSFPQLVQLSRESFEMKVFLRFNGPEWKRRFWEYLSKYETPQIKTFLINVSQKPKKTVFNFMKEIHPKNIRSKLWDQNL